MLKEGLLAEGGGADPKYLDAINADSELTQSQREYKKGDVDLQGLAQFSSHSELFKDLTKRTFIDTEIDVI